MPQGVSFDEASTLILKAAGPNDLFGVPPQDDHESYLAQAKATYRQLALVVHPDTASTVDADRIFARLGELWNKLEERAKAGTLGGIVVSTKTREYAFNDDPVRGDIANVYPGASNLSPKNVVLKIARSPQNADLLMREVRALQKLDDDADPRLRPWAPRLIETFRYTSPDGKQRQTNVLERLDGFYSLSDVKRAYPQGLDARDATWMWRKLLVALGWAHSAGVIHGAVLPSNVMILPEEHGLVLIDWCYSVIDDDHVPVIVSKYSSFYPEEVTAKETPTPSTDIYMAAKVFRWLLNAEAPRALRAFIKGCELTSAASRPNDAWQLLEEFDTLIVKLFGPRRFRHFEMPKA